MSMYHSKRICSSLNIAIAFLYHPLGHDIFLSVIVLGFDYYTSAAQGGGRGGW